MKLTREEWIAAGVVGAGLAFGLLGAYSSFEAVDARMEPSFGDESWMVPVGADLGIAVFTAGDLWMAWRGWRTWWLRFLPLGLSLATLYLNVVGEPTMEGRVGHGLLVFLWIAFAHAVAHVVHLHAVGRREHRARWWRRADRPERLDRIRLSRWVLAPWPTFRLWRDMVLWEVRSYKQALTMVQERALALCDIEETYPSFGDAPRRVQTLYRLARFDELADLLAAEKAPMPVARPVTNVTSNGDHPAELIAQDMKARGERVSRRSLQARAKAERVPLGTSKAIEIAGRYS